MLCESVDEIVDVVVANQVRFFSSIAPSEPVFRSLRAKFGPNYVKLICAAMGTTLRQSILFDTVAVQPFKAPVDMFYYRMPVNEHDGPPIGPVHSAQFEVETRKMRAGLDLEGTPLDNFIREVFSDEVPGNELLKLFNAAWGEVEREVLSTLYSASTAPITVRRCQISEDLHGLRHGIQHVDVMGPANALVMGPSDFYWIYGQLKDRIKITDAVNFVDRPKMAATLDGTVSIYADEFFPEDRVLAFRRPKDNLDRTCMWSPFLFMGAFWACGTGEQLVLALRSRQKITLLDQGFLAHGTLQ